MLKTIEIVVGRLCKRANVDQILIDHIKLDITKLLTSHIKIYLWYIETTLYSAMTFLREELCSVSKTAGRTIHPDTNYRCGWLTSRLDLEFNQKTRLMFPGHTHDVNIPINDVPE